MHEVDFGFFRLRAVGLGMRLVPLECVEQSVVSSLRSATGAAFFAWARGMLRNWRHEAL